MQTSSSRPSLWRAINPPGPPSTRLDGTYTAEFAIVGAGVAGLSTALHLALEGREVVVIEALEASHDGASASAGVIAPQLVRNTPKSVVRKLGRDRGLELLRLIAESGRYLFQTAADHQIACAQQTAGFLAPVPAASGLAAVAEVIEDWAAVRNDLRLVDADAVEQLTGCRGYIGALLDESGGGVDPVALLHGLERAALAAGARIYRRSPVQEVQRHRSGWGLKTAGGVVNATGVVLCANGGNPGLHPALQGSVLPLPVIQVATRPLPEAMRRHILAGGHTMTDTATDILSLRYDAGGRLITAIGGERLGDPAEIDRRVNQRLQSVLPAYSYTPLEYVWSGTALINGSLLPRAVALEPGLMAVQACNGRGLAVNLISGREIARRLADPAYQMMLPLGPARRVPAYALLRHVPRLMVAGGAAWRRLTAR